MSSSGPQAIREKLERVLRDKESVRKSAAISFEQFDKDKSGSLDFSETQKLLNRLFKNLQIPNVDDSIIEQVFARYDDGDGGLEITEFTKLYYDLLLRIRDKYYPAKSFKVRREIFVGHHSLKGGRRIQDILSFDKKLGSGSFGQVYLVTEKDSELERVCKIINKDRAALPLEQIQAEIDFMKTLDHPNIIKIYDVYEDYNSIYIIMESCHGGELMERISIAQKAGRRLNEKYTAGVMRQMMEALAYFHGEKIAHKDLKPENVMFLDKSSTAPLKVIDFGVAELFNSNESSTKASGTALYMAPEVWKRCFNIKCDIWSAGCILYLMLTGRLPYMGSSLKEVQRKILSGEPNWGRDCRGISTEALELLQQMLRKDPHKRPSAASVLKHEWFGKAPEAGATLTPEFLDNMQKFSKGSAVKQALGNFLTHQLNVSGSQIRNIISVFRSLDKDHNGMLSSEELNEGLKEAGWSQWDINKLVQSLDVDDSGQINYTEFLTACYSWQEEEINVIWGAFNKMDTAGDGKIPTGDLVKALVGGEMKYGDEDEVKKMVDEIDEDQNGFVDWDEFVKYIRGEGEETSTAGE